MPVATLQALVEDALLRGSGTALSHPEGTLSYAELERTTRNLALALAGQGVGPGKRVALHGEKSLRTVSWLLAIVRTGAAYVPLEPRLPLCRKELLLRLAAPEFVVGDEPVPSYKFLESGSGAKSDWSRAAPGDSAYILFTSGSTGAPKAVDMSQASAAAFAQWGAAATQISHDDVIMSTSALSFDLSTFDLFSGLGSGARIALVPRAQAAFAGDLAELLDREKVSVWYSVPSTVELLVKNSEPSGWKLPRFRALICAGDIFPRNAAEKLRAHTGCRLFNFYGPTETNVCTAYEVPPGIPPAPPIGFPTAGNQCVIRGEHGAILESGYGELLVAGPTLMSGYRDGACLDRSVFTELRGISFYPTGDLVEKAADGPYQFRGRKDEQVKCWGYRVHPAETERALSALGGVTACAVVSAPDERAGNLLHAFVVRTGSASEAELLSGLRLLLPAHALPETITFLAALPLAANAKVDRAGLAASVCKS